MRKLYAVVFAIIVWLALILQFYLAIINRIVAVPETILRYFSYFTIQINILVAVSYTAVVMRGFRGKGLTGPAALTATTVYILIVGITYNSLLRSVWEPKGLQLWVDEALHTVI